MVPDENTLTAGEWHLLQSMLQQRIRESEAEGIDENTPSGRYQRELSRKLLHHELRMREIEHPGWQELPEPLRSMSFQERQRLTSEEWLKAWDDASPPVSHSDSTKDGAQP